MQAYNHDATAAKLLLLLAKDVRSSAKGKVAFEAEG